MKIIRVGSKDVVKEDMIAECPQCNCVFTFGEHESKQMSNNGGGSVYYANCPQCGSHNCHFDTGYPGYSGSNKEADLRCDASVKAEHARLRALISAIG